MECYLENTVLPQVLVDKDLYLRKFTPGALRSFALSKTDQGRPLHELRDHFRFTRIEEDILAVLSSGTAIDKDVRSSDKRWYQMKITPYCDHHGNTEGVLLTFIDISSKVKRMKALESSLEKNEILLDRISHDIRSPLTNMLLAIEEFSGMNADSLETAKKYAALIARSIRRMQGVIADLTDQRRAAVPVPEELSFLDFSRMLDDVYTSLHQDIKKSGASFTYRPGATRFLYSRQKLRSILFNLVSNAIKYTVQSRRPEIIISTSNQEQYLLVEVKDNGAGIHPHLKEKIFEKYQRGGASCEGTGMGLYLVKQLVEEDGGWVEVESKPGEGSTFRIFLSAGSHRA